MRILAVILLVAGVLALFFGGFSYSEDKTVAKLGTFELKAKETHTINFPVWGGAAAIAVGALLLVMGGRKR